MRPKDHSQLKRNVVIQHELLGKNPLITWKILGDGTIEVLIPRVINRSGCDARRDFASNYRVRMSPREVIGLTDRLNIRVQEYFEYHSKHREISEQLCLPITAPPV
jgi:hypothetical protein